MFLLLLLVGGIGGAACAFWFFAEEEHRKYSYPIFMVCLVIFTGAWFTSSGEIYRKQFFASSVKGNWLVVDNSGGETMRHWIINGYVKDSSQSDGWQFSDNNGNLCYVSGDAYVMQINQPLQSFLENYKVLYNIPPDQVALK